MSSEERSRYPLCGARTKSGGTCRNFAGEGTSHKGYGRCKFHFGNTATHNIAATKAAVAREIRIFGEEMPVEPIEALLWMLRLSAGHVAFMRNRLAELSDEEQTSFKGQARFRLYSEERDRTARIAKAALDAGVAERSIRLAEQYGELLATLISGILDDLSLTLAQRELAAEVVPRRLLALEPGGLAETA
jgi:hypothetical protein